MSMRAQLEAKRKARDEAAAKKEADAAAAAAKARQEAVDAKERAAIASSEALKDAGNKLFKAGLYEEAGCTYTEALGALPRPDAPSAAAILANRALCHSKRGANQQLVVDDCAAALAIDPRHFKAMLRRAQALEAQGPDPSGAFTRSQRFPQRSDFV
jgi:import receptor subunit TOM70